MRVSNNDVNIIDYIPTGKDNGVTRRQLCIQTGLSDRIVRKLISLERRKTVIINEQNGNGYYIPGAEDIRELQLYCRQEENRAKSIFWSLRAARKALKEVESWKEIT